MLLLFASGLLIHFGASAQSETDANNQLLIVGNAEGALQLAPGEANFTDINFKPIFLWKISDKLFVESEIEIETGEGSADLGLEYANMCYTVNPYMTIHAGRFLPKFGTYRGRFAEAFINRFASNPAGFGDGGIGPMNETGIGVQGGIPMGSSKMNYDVWVSNGPQLSVGSADAPDEAGQLIYEAYTDNNMNKCVGGRIGFLPFSNSCLEIGVSDESVSKLGDAGSDYENVKANMYAADMIFFHNINPIKSTFRLNAEYKSLSVGDYTYSAFDSLNTTYTFANNSSAYYVGASIRPASLSKTIFRNVELGYRYSSFNRPDGSMWGDDYTQTSASLDYWLNWCSVIKACYTQNSGEDPLYTIQFVMGF